MPIIVVVRRGAGVPPTRDAEDGSAE